MRSRTVFATMAIGFSITCAAYGALSNKDANLIKIAFQNGYLAALRLSSEQIQRLKSDNATLEKFVEEASEKYLKQVQQMNK